MGWGSSYCPQPSGDLGIDRRLNSLILFQDYYSIRPPSPGPVPPALRPCTRSTVNISSGTSSIPNGRSTIVDQIRLDDHLLQIRDHPFHHPGRTVDEAALNRDHLLGPPHKVPLAGVLGERAAKADPDGLIPGKPVGDQICRPPGNFAPGTCPFAGHHRDLRRDLWSSLLHSPRRPGISRSLLQSLSFRSPSNCTLHTAWEWGRYISRNRISKKTETGCGDF